MTIGTFFPEHSWAGAALAFECVKSMTTSGLDSANTRSRSGATATPSSASPATLPMSWPRAGESVCSVPPTTRKSRSADTSRTMVLPIFPAAPVMIARITGTSEQRQPLQLILELGGIRLAQRHQGRPDLRAKLAHQVKSPLDGDRIRLHEQEPVEVVHPDLQLPRFRQVAGPRRLDQIRHHPRRHIRRDRDHSRSTAGDERQHGEIISRNQREAVSAFFDDVDGADHACRGFFDADHLGDFAQALASFRQQIDAGTPRNVIGHDWKTGMSLCDQAVVLEQTGLTRLVVVGRYHQRGVRSRFPNALDAVDTV